MNSYPKTIWKNGQAPALSAENLNKIENGIEAVTDAETELEAEVDNLTGDLQGKMNFAQEGSSSASQQGQLFFTQDTIGVRTSLEGQQNENIQAYSKERVDAELEKKLTFKTVQFSGSSYFPNIDTATENDVQYLVIENNPVRVYGTMFFTGNKDRASYPVSQTLITNDGMILIRATSNVFGGIVTWENDWSIINPLTLTQLGVDVRSLTAAVNALNERTIAGLSLESDISAEDLADALYDDLELEDYALLQKAGSIPTISDLKNLVKGQYYYSSERRVIGVKLSDATSSSGPAPVYIEAYSTEAIDDMIGDIETLLSQV